MINDPHRYHHFVLLFELNNADLGGSSELEPGAWAGPVKYGLITGGTLKGLISHRVARENGLPALLSLRGRVQRQLLKPLELGGDPQSLLKPELCRYFYDVRLFGLTANGGRIPGPMRLSSARSVDPVLPWDPGRAGSYGLYRLHGSYDPGQGRANGVTAQDLETFWKTLGGLFESGSSLRPLRMAGRGLWIFSQESSRSPVETLLEQVSHAKVGASPRSFGDYALRYPSPGPLPEDPATVLTHWA